LRFRVFAHARKRESKSLHDTTAERPPTPRTTPSEKNAWQMYNLRLFLPRASRRVLNRQPVAETLVTLNPVIPSAIAEKHGVMTMLLFVVFQLPSWFPLLVPERGGTNPVVPILHNAAADVSMSFLSLAAHVCGLVERCQQRIFRHSRRPCVPLRRASFR